MTNPDLSGRTAVVTGGSRGLGREMALAFADHGAHVVVASRKLDNCEAVAAEVESRGREALPQAHRLEVDGNELRQRRGGHARRLDSRALQRLDVRMVDLDGAASQKAMGRRAVPRDDTEQLEFQDPDAAEAEVPVRRLTRPRAARA